MTFEGFPPGRFQLTQLPEPFFTDVLPQVDDLAELKLLLFCFWALPQKDSDFPHLQWAEFTGHQPLMDGLQAARPDDPAEATLHDALERSVKRGVLLQATIDLGNEERTLYFVNTERGRQAVEQVKAGAWQTGASLDVVHILPPRPNIYKLYESNIGPLTPIIADQLKDLETEHPPDWIEEAIKLATLNNARNLRYVIAILERWRKEGKTNGEQTGRRAEESDEYDLSKSEFAKFFRK